MRTEVSLRHAAQSLVEHSVYDISHRSIRVQPQYGGLPVVISGYKYILVLCVRRQMAAPHPLDVGGIESCNRPVLMNPE